MPRPLARTTRRQSRPIRTRKLQLTPLEDRSLLSANLLVSVDGPPPTYSQLLQEYTSGGTLVSETTIPDQGEYAAGDLVRGVDGRVSVFNGTSSPILSNYDGTSWSSLSFDGMWQAWNLAYNSYTFGGLGQHGNLVYAADMQVNGDLSYAAGVVRFNLDTGTSDRIVSGWPMISATVGRNGKLYSLDDYNELFVYDRTTGAQEDVLALPYTVNGYAAKFKDLAVNAAGEIFATDYQNNRIVKFDENGAVLGSVTLTPPSGYFYPATPIDIDVSGDGTLAVGTTGGYVFQMAQDLTGVTAFHTGAVRSFVAFVEPPPPAISIADASVVESDYGSTLTLTVSLSRASDQAITVDYSTADGSATSWSDYEPLAGTLTFAAGETSKNVEVTIYGDSIVEIDETLSLVLSNATNATIADATGSGTIVNDDLPTVSIGNVYAFEGASGNTIFVFPVTLSAPSSQPVTVGFGTSDGTATWASDYSAASDTVTFNPGETTAAIHITVNGDRTIEANETLSVTLWNPSGALLGTSSAIGTIANDDFADFASPASVWGYYAEYFNGSAPTVTSGGSYIDVFAANEPPISTGGPAPREYRGLFEYSLPAAVMGGDFASAIVTFHQTYTYPGSAAIQIFGYAADQTIGIDDGTAPGVLLGTFDPLAASGARSAVLDRNALAGLLANSNVVGLRFITTPDSQVRLETASANRPTVHVFRDAFVAPTVGVADAQAVEGDNPAGGGQGNTVQMPFTVSLSAAVNVPVDVTYTLFGGTATVGTDLLPVDGTVRINPGQTTATIYVPVLPDNSLESNETFTLRIKSALFATIGDGEATGTIVDNDAAPQITYIAAQPGLENTVVGRVYAEANYSLTGNITVTWDFGDGSSVSGTPQTMLNQWISHLYLNSGSYTARVTVTDSIRGQGTQTVAVDVHNSIPTLAATAPTVLVANHLAAFSFTANDVSPADRAAGFNLNINWGDGQGQGQFVSTATSTISHAYAMPGTYTVTAHALDQEFGQSSTWTKTVTVSQVGMVGIDLVVSGTPGNDNLVIASTTNSSNVTVTLNGASLGTFTLPTQNGVAGTVYAYGGNGNDVIEARASVINSVTYQFPRAVAFHGGAGNDNVRTSPTTSASSVLVGGSGHDTLTGGNGFDILVGGLGIDSLTGGNNSDILIGNKVTFEDDLTAMRLLRLEWGRTDISLQAKVDHILGNVPNGHNGTFFLNASTIVEDNSIDDLWGNAGTDWFFAAPSGTWADRRRDFTGGEYWTYL